MLAGFLSEKLRKTIFVLGMMMMTFAGAMEQMDSEVLVDPVQCAINLESEKALLLLSLNFLIIFSLFKVYTFSQPLTENKSFSNEQWREDGQFLFEKFINYLSELS